MKRIIPILICSILLSGCGGPKEIRREPIAVDCVREFEEPRYDPEYTRMYYDYYIIFKIYYDNGEVKERKCKVFKGVYETIKEELENK